MDWGTSNAGVKVQRQDEGPCSRTVRDSLASPGHAQRPMGSPGRKDWMLRMTSLCSGGREQTPAHIDTADRCYGGSLSLGGCEARACLVYVVSPGAER